MAQKREIGWIIFKIGLIIWVVSCLAGMASKGHSEILFEYSKIGVRIALVILATGFIEGLFEKWNEK